MDFIFTEPQTEYERLVGGFYYVNMIGKIEREDGSRFQRFLDVAAPPASLTTFYFDSSGGDVEAAIEIGRTLREHWYSTSIGNYQLQHGGSEIILRRQLVPAKCLSAATLAYIGGKLRYFPEGSKFGVHQFAFNNPTPNDVGQSQVMSSKIAKYINEMGVAPEFMEVSAATPSEQVSLLSREELQGLNVVTGGETEAQWTVHARAGMIYVRGERSSLFGHQKVMLAHTKNVGFLFMAFVEAQGRVNELTTFGVVEIVINGEDVIIDISSRCERVESGIYVNIVAVLNENEARMIAFSESFGVRVRMTVDAPIFLGIAAMSTEGGREQLETLYGIF